MKKPVITIMIAAVNIIVFFALSFIGMTEDASFMAEHGAMFVPYVTEQGEYYRIFTSMFLHFGFQHLMNNMVMLIAIGYTLEHEVGKFRFFIIYLISGLGGTFLSMWQDIHTGQYAVAAGASGAIFGLLGATLLIAARNRGRVGEISGRGLLFTVGISLYFGYANGGVDNFAHIGGLLTGMILAVLLMIIDHFIRKEGM
ncbi:rhomboid family intramembrane serine protease [Lachnospiraceae bacterium 48-42]|jgi:Uncharacterized membrane protein (homolog of Drosophila rhomboid)|nr:rhomboid family intramembrane serine protease [Dorea sp.]